VQNVATGARRTWSAWRSADAVLSGFSWGPSGQLGFTAVLDHASVSHGRPVQAAKGMVSAFMVLSTHAPGSDLIGDSHQVRYTVRSGHTGSSGHTVSSGHALSSSHALSIPSGVINGAFDAAW
jgi:hypothetical protein